MSPFSNYLSFDSVLFQIVMCAGVLVVGRWDIALAKMYEPLCLKRIELDTGKVVLLLASILSNA